MCVCVCVCVCVCATVCCGSSSAGDKAAGRSIANDFQAAASSRPADGATVVHQVECPGYRGWTTHPAYNHVSAGDSVNVGRRRRADNTDCWCNDDDAATSHTHKDVVINNHYNDHCHQFVNCLTHCCLVYSVTYWYRKLKVIY